MSDTSFSDLIAGSTGWVAPTPAPAAAPAPAPAAAPTAADSVTVTQPGGFDATQNEYAARRLADPSYGEVGLWDRATANMKDSWRRGTLLGAGSLAAARLILENPLASANAKATAATYLDHAQAQMLRYEAIPDASGPAESVAALVGNLIGNSGSPEAFVTHIPGLGRLFGGGISAGSRIAEAAATQGIVNVATDPLVQAESHLSGVQKDYDYARTALAFPLGVAGGAVLGGAGELIHSLLKKPSIPGREPLPSLEEILHPQNEGARTPDGELLQPGARLKVNDYVAGTPGGRGPYDGMSGTVVRQTENGYVVHFDDGTEAFQPAAMVTGITKDGTPSAPPPAPAAAPVPDQPPAPNGAALVPEAAPPAAEPTDPRQAAADFARAYAEQLKAMAAKDVDPTWRDAAMQQAAAEISRADRIEAEIRGQPVAPPAGETATTPAVAAPARAAGEAVVPEAKKAGGAQEPAPLIGEAVSGMARHSVSTASGASIDVAPVVVEANKLITSADPGYDQTLQPRNRDRAASGDQIQQMVNTLNPERLGKSTEADRGAPIVGDDGMVESGNGRIAALRQAYAKNGPQAAAYRQWLASQGVDVAKYHQPVLVRQRLTPMTPAERQAFGIDANRAATLGLSASERAMADGQNISGAMFDLIRNTDDLGAISNRDFVRSFVGTLPVTERAGMLTEDSSLSSEGLMRVRNAVLARAYGDAAVLTRVAEATSDDVKSLSNALVSIAPQWAGLRADVELGKVRHDLDLTPELIDAVNRTAEMRSKGVKFDAYLAQIDAFNPLPPATESFMRMFYDGKRASSGKNIADRLRAYAVEARKISADKSLMLDMPDVTIADLQRIAGEKAREAATSAQLFLRGGPGTGTGAEGRTGAGGAREGVGGPGAQGDQGRPDLLAAGAGGQPPAAGGEPASPHARAVRTLYQQSFDLADALGFPLRQGRVQAGANALGQYDWNQDVVRIRSVADFHTVAHEAGHALEKRVAGLDALIQQHAAELGPLDYKPARADPREGFAEWMRWSLTAPAYAQRRAPGFQAAFDGFMHTGSPEILAKLDAARAGYAAWQSTPGNGKIAAMVQRRPTDSLVERMNKDGLPATVAHVLRRSYEVIFDKSSPLTRAVRSLARSLRDASGQVPELKAMDNPMALLPLMQRSHQASTADLSYGVRPFHQITPRGPSLRAVINAAIGRAGWFGSWDEEAVQRFSAYITAREGVERWKDYDAGAIPNEPFGGTINKAETYDAVAQLEREHPSFAAAGTMFHEYTRELLTKMADGNLIPRELHAKLMAKEFYAPLYRVRSDKPLDIGRPTGPATRTQGPGAGDILKKFRGSGRDIIDPLQSIISQTFLVNRTIAHNDIILALRNLQRRVSAAGGTGHGQIVEEIPAHEVEALNFDLTAAVERTATETGATPDEVKILMGAMTDMFGEDPIMATLFRTMPTRPRGEPILFYKEGGQMKALRLIADREGMALYETLASLPTDARDVAMKLGAISAASERAGIVTAPSFMITNWVKDQLATAIIRPDYIPFNPKGILGEITQSQMAQLYSYAGGVSPGAGSAGLQQLFNGEIAALAHAGWLPTKTRAFGGNLWKRGNVLEAIKALGEFTEAGEAGTRVNVMTSVFNRVRRDGGGEWEATIAAAHEASDLMEFGQNGSGTQTIRKLIPFLNASFVGLDKWGRTLFTPLYRAMTGDIVTTAERSALTNAGLAWFKFAALGGAAGYMYGLWASQYEAYLDADPTLRATHLILPGDALGDPGNQWVIPKPFEWSIFMNAGELLAQYTTTGDPRVKQWALTGLAAVLAPPNPLTEIPVVKTYYQMWANKRQFTGRPIIPDRLMGVEPGEQWTEKTSAFAKAIGKALGVSPIMADFAVCDQFGTLGRDFMSLSGNFDPEAPTVPGTQQVIIRRFYKNSEVSSAATRRFYDLAASRNGEYAQAVDTYQADLNRQGPESATEFLSHLPADKQAFVIISKAVDASGKDAFTAADRRVHPYVRAANAVEVISGYMRELGGNLQRSIADGQAQPMDPPTKRALIDNLDRLRATEMQNAMIIMHEPGFANRKISDPENQFKVIEAISPVAGKELATRYANQKIWKTDAVARDWPEAQKRLLRDGGAANLRDLRADAEAGGPAFDGTRVKKYGRQRMQIPGMTGLPAGP